MRKLVPRSHVGYFWCMGPRKVRELIALTPGRVEMEISNAVDRLRGIVHKRTRCVLSTYKKMVA